MIVTAWNNGKHHSSGAGYGIKLSIADRDAHFERDWQSVFVTLPNGQVVEANTNKPSFWGRSCRELIDQKFGQWMISEKLAPWKKGQPPQFLLTQFIENRFRLEMH